MKSQQLINNYITQAKQIYSKFKNQTLLTNNKDLMFDLFHCSLKICHIIDTLKAKNVLSKDYNHIRECFNNFANSYCNYNNFLGKKIFTLQDIETKQMLKQALYQSFKNLEQSLNINFETNNLNEQMQF